MSDYETRAKLHQMHRGFVNIAYLAGWLRHPTSGGFYVQQTDDESKMIPVEFDPGVRLPRGIGPGDRVKLLGRLVGRPTGRNESDGPERTMVVKLTNPRSMLSANLLDMPASEDYFKVISEHGRASTIRPPEFGSVRKNDRISLLEEGGAGVNELVESTGSLVWAPSKTGFTTSNSSNEVVVCGMLISMKVLTRRQDNEPAAVKARLRMTDNPDEDVTVHFVGKYAGKVMRSILPGMVAVAHGEIRMQSLPRLDAEGKPVLVDGVAAVDIRPFILAGARKFEGAKASVHYEVPMPKWMTEFAEAKRVEYLAEAALSRNVANRPSTPAVDAAGVSTRRREPAEVTA